MNEKLRLKKVFLWQLASFILTSSLAWFYFGYFNKAVVFSLLITIIKIVGLYFYDKKWEMNTKH